MDDAFAYDPCQELITGVSHPIIEACKNSDCEQFQRILAEFAASERPLTVCNHSGQQAIHFAASLSNVTFLSALVNVDSSLIHSETFEKTTPLMIAASYGIIDAVKIILPLLTDGEVFATDLHGVNALYYAVYHNGDTCNSICELLMERLTCPQALECSTAYDTLPFRTVKKKNSTVLTALLSAGLSPAYSCGHNSQFEDSSYSSDVHIQTKPSTLVGYCVKEQWLEGVQIVIEAQKQLLSGASPRKRKHMQSPYQLFTNNAGRGSNSALKIIFERGDVDYLRLMLDEGFPLPTFNEPPTLLLPPNYIGPARGSNSSHSPFHLLSLAVSGDIWAKRPFIKYLLSNCSCAQFQEFYQSRVRKYVNVNRVQRVDQYLNVDAHPLLCVMESIRNCSERHPFSSSVDMLLDNGFTFDLVTHDFNPDGEVSWCDPITRLITELPRSELELFEVVLHLLKHRPSITLTADAVAHACTVGFHARLEVESRPDTALEPIKPFLRAPHLPVLKALSQKPAAELRDAQMRLGVTEDCVVLADTSSIRKRRRPDFAGSPANWFIASQLILKGVQVLYFCPQWLDRYIDTSLHCRVSFSSLMLSDQERQLRLRNLKCTDSFELALKETRVSSLQSLCRRVIRAEIGFSRLLREPVPRVYPGLEVEVDDSWEISSIEQLSIPKLLKEYLRFTPELQDYLEYYKRSINEHPHQI